MVTFILTPLDSPEPMNYPSLRSAIRDQKLAHPELMPDIPMIRKQIEWVESELEASKHRHGVREWVQNVWMFIPGTQNYANYMATRFDMDEDEIVKLDCGTACCVAGHVVLQTRPESEWKPYAQLLGDHWGDDLTNHEDLKEELQEAAEYYPRAAAEELRLTQSVAAELFYSENSATCLREIAEIIADEFGERL